MINYIAPVHNIAIYHYSFSYLISAVPKKKKKKTSNKTTIVPN